MFKFTIDEIYRIVISAYDRIAEAYTTAYAEDDEFDFKYLDDFVEMLNGKSILDMGCGTGTNQSYMSKREFDVIGIDASKGMLDVAKRNFPTLNFVEGNILCTGFEDGSFDGIVLAYTINHFNDSGLSILASEIRRLLKMDGLIFISAHVGKTQEIVADPLDEKIEIYYNLLTPEKLDSVFTGFERIYLKTRESFGEEEFLWDKMFLIYRKVL